MVNKPQPKQSNIDHPLDDPFQLQRVLKQHVNPDSTLLLALSGGVDSVVLLHLLHALHEQVPFELHAMHVHHGLSPNADQWASHCQWLCQQFQIPFTIARVDVSKQGKGTEAAARQARYDALFAYTYQSKQPDWILTAHHQQDQAETFLLQLFRGTGVKGLSAMQTTSDQRVLRPLLNISKEAILAYANQHQLSWCEDESNQDTQFDRNFIRQQLMPSLKARYPNLDATLAKTADHMAETQALLTVLAKQDAQDMIQGARLNIVGLSSLSESRFNNVLRFWFESMHLEMPSSKRLAEIANQLRYAKADAAVRLQHQGHVLLRYDGVAYVYDSASLPEFVAFDLCWNGQARMTLPNGCIVNFKGVTGRGIAVKHLSTPLSIRSRVGGERFKLKANRPEKSLKKWFQSSKVPPWEREVIPLFFVADYLAYVPGIGVAEGYAAAEGEEGLEIKMEIVNK